jgi:hypothetical protein
VKVGHQPLHHVSNTFIASLRIYNDGVFGDIVDIEILHGRDFDVFGIHLGGCIVVSRSARARKYL